MIRFDRFSEGKIRAVVLSFDDGRVQDRRLVALLNKYGLKATFHLNSGKLGAENYISADEIKNLYAGHEIASHGQFHARLKNCPSSVVIAEILNDRKTLENITDSIITGFAYAYGDCNDAIKQATSSCEIEYARTTVHTHTFEAPDDFIKWHPTNHILQAYEDVQRFLGRMDVLGRDSVLFLWGHSFELDEKDGWQKAEELFEMVANNEDIWYTTCGEYYQYIKTVRNLKISVDEGMACNPSAIPVWISYDRKAVKVNGGEIAKL